MRSMCESSLIDKDLNLIVNDIYKFKSYKYVSFVIREHNIHGTRDGLK